MPDLKTQLDNLMAAFRQYQTSKTASGVIAKAQEKVKVRKDETDKQDKGATS